MLWVLDLSHNATNGEAFERHEEKTKTHQAQLLTMSTMAPEDVPLILTVLNRIIVLPPSMIDPIKDC